MTARPTFVVIGGTNIARHVCASLADRACPVEHLIAPGDDELRAALAKQPGEVAILLHDDVAALRYALTIAHLAPQLPIIVTIFDRTVARELLHLLPQCHVTSPADIAAPTLAGPCVAATMAAIHHRPEGIRAVHVLDGQPLVQPWQPRPRGRALASRLAGQLRPHDGGTRIMLAGLLGLFVALLIDWTWLTHAGLPPAAALFDAVRVVATVGPADPPDNSTAYQVVSSVIMLSTIVFAAMFTAGLIDRLLGPQLVGLIGPRALPRFDHVIVVGVGQIGLRLCGELRRLGIPVVGVERDREAPNVRLARSLGIPVVAGHGEDRAVLERLRLRQAKAIAAVGSDDLENIAVALAAHAVAPETRIVLRAGEHEAIAETRSLLPLGVVRDVNRLAAAYVLARLLREPATGALVDEDQIFIEIDEERFAAWPLAARDECGHRNVAGAR